MIYIIAVFFILLLILILLQLKQNSIVNIDKVTYLDSDSSKSIQKLAIKLNEAKGSGKSVSIFYIKRSIYKAYRIIIKEIKNGDIISQKEKWFYDNFSLINEYLNMKHYKKFIYLPHNNINIRVIELALYIVNRTNLSLNIDEIDNLIYEFNTTCQLKQNEVMALKDAIAYVLILKLSINSNKIIEENKIKNIAKKNKKFNKNYSNNIVYLYHYYKYNKDNSLFNNALDKNKDEITLSYEKILLEEELEIKSIIIFLREIDNKFSLNKLLQYSSIDRMLSKNVEYSISDTVSKYNYINAVISIAKKLHVKEKCVINTAFDLAEEYNMHFGDFLFNKVSAIKSYIKKKPIRIKNTIDNKLTKVYVSSIILVSTLITAFLVLFMYKSTYSLLLVFPLFVLVFKSFEMLFNSILHQVIKNRPICKLNKLKVDDENATMIVVSEYLKDNLDINSIKMHLNSLSKDVTDDNISVTLLVDFKSSDEEWSSQDDVLLNSLINSLNDDVNIFVRKRVIAGDRYVAHERKRGAIMDLFDFIINNNRNNFKYIKYNNKYVKYAFMLDSDSEILPNAILNAVNTISHPLNEKYDLMTANARYNMYSLKSLFSLKYLKNSGTEEYASYSNLLYNISSYGIYQGKGIINIRNFYNKLKDTIKDNSVLSHDLLEGALVCSGELNEYVYEDAPSTFIAERERNSRWMKGDLLLLKYANNRSNYSKNNKNTIKKPLIYKYLAYSNAISCINSITLLGVIIYSMAVFNYTLLGIFCGILFVPTLYNILFKLSNINKNIRIKCVMSDIIYNLSSFIMYLVNLPFTVYHNIRVILNIVKVKITNKGILNWKTFSEVNNELNLMIYVKYTLFYVFILIIAMILSLIYSKYMIFTYMLISIFGLLILGILSKNTKHSKKTYREDYFRKLAVKTYKYFSTINNKAKLIVDNYQVSPYKGKANYTSPTNIGFSLLAEIAGYHLGCINIGDALSRINSILNEINSLEKYKGNLYNWYDTQSKAILIPKFISSVDNGNLLASLIVTREFIIDFSCDYTLIDRLIEDMDFSIFYIEDRDIFAIGYDVENNSLSGNYDLLASEARLFNFLAAIKTGHISAFANLSRKCIKYKGNTLLSWSGTMFEYLMPSIFIDDTRFTMMNNTLYNVVYCQSRHLFNGIYGVSESAYAEFDDNFHYQYHAFGINKLAIRNERDQAVISPYSSILGITYQPQRCYKNIQKLTDLGMNSEYGLYEAIDFRREKTIVSSYMSHHQGMILMSLDNYLNDNIIVKYFMSNNMVRGGRLLLAERESDTRGIKNINIFAYKDDNAFKYKANACYNTIYPNINLLTNGKMSLLVADDTSSYAIANGRYISLYTANFNYKYGAMVYLSDGNDAFNFIRKSIDDDNIDCIFFHNKTQFINKKHNAKMTYELPFGLHSLKKTIEIYNNTDEKKYYNVAYFDRIMMSRFDDYNSHPVFQNMFVNTEYDKTYNAIIVRRKDKDSLNATYSAFIIDGLEQLDVDSNASNVLSRYERQENINYPNKNQCYISFGDVLNPCYFAQGKLIIQPHSTNKVTFYTLYNDDKHKLYEEMDALFDKSNILGENIPSINVVYDYIDNSRDYEVMLRLGSLILFKPSKIVNGKKIIAYEGGKSDNNYIKLIKMQSYLSTFDILFDIVVIDNKYDKKYRDLIENAVIVIDNLSISVDEIKILGTKYRSLEKIKVKVPKLKFQNDFGGFDFDDNYIIKGKPNAPYSNVVCLSQGGFIATENGVMYSYSHNSRENKLTEWKNDALTDTPSEKVYLVKDNCFSRINMGYDKGYTMHSLGYTSYFNHLSAIDVECKRSILDDGNVQLIDICLENKGFTTDINIILELELALGVLYDANNVGEIVDKNTIKFVNLSNDKSIYIRSFDSLTLLNGVRNRLDRYDDLASDGHSSSSKAVRVDKNLKHGDVTHIYLMYSDSLDALDEISIYNVNIKLNDTIAHFNNANKWEISSDDKALDIFFNKWLLYQIESSRLNGRTAYYQAGGAIGFRDQLQDLLAMLYNDSNYVRERLLDIASHQYLEGDVMHWWHPPCYGVRTRITDDRLFLPYVVDEYIKVTGDEDILKEEVPYIQSSPLKDNEISRLEQAKETTMATMLDHMIRAIDISLKFGEHGLCLIGTGDWNDALDGIGIMGKGESVWLSMFLYDNLCRIRKYVDKDKAKFYENIAKKLKESIESAYSKDRYMRAYTDNNEWLGREDSDVCKIDLLCQSFAVLCNIGTYEQNSKALNTAMKLYQPQYGLIELLDPPFNRQKYYGYISNYPEGMRENGGQYTHSAIWYIMAEHKIGNTKLAKELFDSISTIKKIGNKNYLVEPYVVSADIYSAKGYEGRGGWTWYTGSASWTYKYLLNMLYGIEKIGDKIVINKHKGDPLTNYTIKYHYGKSLYVFRISESTVKELIIDKIKTKYSNIIPLCDDGLEHYIDYYY